MKKAIQLSGGTEQDQMGNNLTNYFTYRTSINDHAQFWLKPLNVKTKDLNAAMKIISEDLMEKDYSEVQSGGHSGNIHYQGKIAYHQNHGTAHGLRQREYQTQYLELVKEQGTEAFKLAAKSLTSEELEIMKLSAYMHRIGRTNERGFLSDPLYGPRSMQIFTQVALDLGFDSKLVKFVAGTMNKFRSARELLQQNSGDPLADPDYSSFSDVPVGCAREKAILFERLIELGHQTDLVRCWGYGKYLDVHVNLAKRLDGMLTKSCDIKEMAGKFLDLAGILCQTTGAPVNMLQKSVGRNVQLIVKSANHVVHTKDTLASTADIYVQTLHLLTKPSVNHVVFPIKKSASQWDEEKKSITLVFKDFAKAVKVINHENGFQCQANHMLYELDTAQSEYFKQSIPTSKARDAFIQKTAGIMLKCKPKVEPVAWETLKDIGVTLLNALRSIARCFGANMPRQILFSEHRIGKENKLRSIINEFNTDIEKKALTT